MMCRVELIITVTNPRLVTYLIVDELNLTQGDEGGILSNTTSADCISFLSCGTIDCWWVWCTELSKIRLQVTETR